MDLGIEGRRAIVCAASRGLGRACAQSLARNGVDLVINGRDRAALEGTARDIREETGVAVETVAGDISDPAVQAALIEACPEPDILVNNNGGPPRRDFREIDRDAFLQGVVMNMATPVEMIQRVLDGMAARGFGRIVNITSISVKMPVPGLDLSSGARAGLTAFVAGIASGVAAQQRHDQQRPARLFRHRASAQQHRIRCRGDGYRAHRVHRAAHGVGSGQTLRRPCRVRRGLRLPLQRPGRLHHRPEPRDRRRPLRQRLVDPLSPNPEEQTSAQFARSVVGPPAGKHRCRNALSVRWTLLIFFMAKSIMAMLRGKGILGHDRVARY